MFEDWPRWLDGLHRHLVCLMKKVDGDETGNSGDSQNLAMIDATAPSGFPAVIVLQELEQVLAILCLAAATNTRDSDVTATTNSGVHEAQPPLGWGVKLFLEVGYSYGAVLDLYCELLDATCNNDIITLDVIDGGSFSVDAREVYAANDSYVLHLIEGILFSLVQWFEVSMKHSITRGKEGSSDTALSELVRYSGSNKGGLITARSSSHSEEQAEEKGGRLGDGRLAAIFDVVTQRMATLAADKSFDQTSPLPAVQAYGKFRRDVVARLSADLEGAKLLQRRFVTDM